jgi:hypothetical protein
MGVLSSALVPQWSARMTDDRVRIAADNAALRRELAILRGEQGKRATRA